MFQVPDVMRSHIGTDTARWSAERPSSWTKRRSPMTKEMIGASVAMRWPHALVARPASRSTAALSAGTAIISHA